MNPLPSFIMIPNSLGRFSIFNQELREWFTHFRRSFPTINAFIFNFDSFLVPISISSRNIGFLRNNNSRIWMGFIFFALVVILRPLFFLVQFASPSTFFQDPKIDRFEFQT